MPDITNIVNTILDNGSSEYKTRVPLATRDNIAAVGNPILTYQPLANEFLSTLVNKIAMTLVQSRIWNNPLSILKKGTKPLGLDIENIHTNPASAAVYDPTGATLLSTKDPDVQVEYFRLNRQDQYEVTVRRPQLKHAFTSWDAMGQLIEDITNSLYSGDYIDEYILTKNALADAVAQQKMITASITAVTTEATAKAFITAVKQASSGMIYPSTSFNAWNKAGGTGTRTTWTPKDKQLLIVRSDILNFIDVNVLAAAFNMGKAEFLTRVVEVDNFGAMDNINAILADDGLLQIWDDLSEMTEFFNPKGLYTNFYWNHWQTYAVSLFANAVAFVDDAVAPAAPVIAATAPGAVKLTGTGEADAILVAMNTTQGVTKVTQVDAAGNWEVACPATVLGNKLNAYQVDGAGNKSADAVEVTVA